VGARWQEIVGGSEFLLRGRRNAGVGQMMGSIFGVLGEIMRAENLSMMSDGELVATLVELVREERRLTAGVLAHLAEVEAKGSWRRRWRKASFM
jgi:hypothetical protein